MSDTAPVEAFFRHIQQGDAGAAIALLHEDVAVSEPAGLEHGGEHRGKAAFVAVMGTITRNYRVELKDFRTIDGGDVTVAIIDGQWTSTATGRSLDIRFCELYTTADGLITGVEVFPKDTRSLHELTLDAH